MPRPNPGRFVAIIDLYREAGQNKIAKTMAEVGRKPDTGTTSVRFEVINRWDKDVTIDWRPRKPFMGNQPPVKVKKNRTRQVVRNIGPKVDRGTYTYVLKINSKKYEDDDPRVIIF